MQPWFSSAIWKPVKGCVTQLAESLHKYSIYLNEKNATVNENHAMFQPVRSASEAESFHLISRARWVKTNVATRFNALQRHIDTIDDFVPVLLNDFAPANARYGNYILNLNGDVCKIKFNDMSMLIVRSADFFFFSRSRRMYIDQLKGSSLLSRVLVYTYASGNSAGNLHFIWKVPEEILDEASHLYLSTTPER